MNFFKNPFKAQPVKAYWWREVPNFGDALAPLLLEHFAGIKVEWGTISHARIASIGSILEHIPPLWHGYILGSGRLLEDSRLHLQQLKSGVTARILALRGPLTARGIPGNYALGDPGLLADELVGPQEKVWDLGIIPHFQDKQLGARFTALCPAPYLAKVINPGDDPLEVLRQIGACRKIVTSSLHGMILADAFAIPRRVEICPAMAKDGGDFKFRDYSASIRMPFITGKVMEPNRFHVEDVKFEIYDAYRALRRELKW
jgi:pyruvyltransferase